MRKEDGFSLLSVIVTLAIVLTLLGSVIPTIETSLQNYRLSASAREIAAEIQSARYRALRANAMSTFMLLPTGSQFGIDVTGDGSITSGTTDVILNLNRSVSFANLSTPPNNMSGVTTLSTGSKSGIGFTPRGTITLVNSSTGLPDFATAVGANGFAVYLSNTRSKYMCITVSPAGRVRTWSSSNGSTWK